MRASKAGAASVQLSSKQMDLETDENRVGFARGKQTKVPRRTSTMYSHPGTIPILEQRIVIRPGRIDYS